MSKKTKSIPVNKMADDGGIGVAIERFTIKDLLTLDNAIVNGFIDAKQSHREDGHSFFLLEKGTVHVEIDFQKYKIKPSSILYLHPDQVHRILALENVTISSWVINNENLNPHYLKLLADITPAKPLLLKNTTVSLICEAVSVCLKFARRKIDKLYHFLLKDSCNSLVALTASLYLEQATPTDKLSRFEIITNAFRQTLERNYTTVKRPAAYAKELNISTPYLNECVKQATGYSVSHHILQRIILEAKRLLYHTDKSVKEIAATLGYDDYPYFSRLFTKATGMTALAFRNKNLD